MLSKPTFLPLGKPVVQLPKLTTPSAAELASKFKPQPAAQALLKPGQSASEYVHALEGGNQSSDAVKALAHGLPERESTWYACQSSQRVAGSLPPADREALSAAEAWVKNPSAATQAQAAAAAAKTNFQGPGAWSAQAAAWAQTTPGAVPSPAIPTMPQASLTPNAATGAVLLAAALEAKAPMPPVPPKIDLSAPALPAVQLPQAPMVAVPELTPPQLAQTAKIHQPYIDLGKDIASGKNTWA